MKIVIDNRESKKRQQLAQNMFEDALIESEISQIGVGDYLLYNDNNEVVCAIEYKTYGDFVSSILNGHLESQLVDMDEWSNPYLFIVGSYGTWRKRTKGLLYVNKKSITGFMVKVLSEHSTKLIQFDSEREALEAMVMLLNRQKLKKGDIKMPERKKLTGNPQLDMYLSIPSIGQVTALMYIDKVSFFQFLYICKNKDAKVVFKQQYGLSVKDSVIDYCSRL